MSLSVNYLRPTSLGLVLGLLLATGSHYQQPANDGFHRRNGQMVEKENG